ncbi:hypothetical protein BY996DRAFT_6532445 [Phakopsora pachyrhizi]|nr:hypothetical protein BY996DRAFT_6532445 [Phakopsora pachyrhizi]
MPVKKFLKLILLPTSDSDLELETDILYLNHLLTKQYLAFVNPTSHLIVPPGIKWKWSFNWKNPDDIWSWSSNHRWLYQKIIQAILNLKDQLVMWPSEDEHKKSPQVMQLEGSPKCIGFVVGTTIPLSQKPTLNGNLYFDLKKRYEYHYLLF